MDFDTLVKTLLEEFTPPYDQRRYRNNRTYTSKGNDISNTSTPTSTTSPYDHKLSSSSPTLLPGSLFPSRKQLQRKSRRHKK